MKRYNKHSLEKCSPRGAEICKNGGKCSVNLEGNAVCNCSVAYNGVHCEIGRIYLIDNNYDGSLETDKTSGMSKTCYRAFLSSNNFLELCVTIFVIFE